MSERSETEAQPKPNPVRRLEAWNVEPADVGISRRVRITLQDDADQVTVLIADAASARDLSDRLLMAAARSVPSAGPSVDDS